MPTIFLVSGTSWDVPDDWNNNDNNIWCLGAGDIGANYAGGGGGAFSSITNLNLTPGTSVNYSIGSAGNYTWFKSTSTVLAQGANGQVGGLSGTSVGSVRYSGGDGSPATTASDPSGRGGTSKNGGPGGGPAGPYGAGQDATSTLGGQGDNGHGGTQGANGSEWGSSKGSGGGGERGLAIWTHGTGSVYNASVTDGGDGGLYGSGAGGGGFITYPEGIGDRTFIGAPGAPGPGLIRISYTPVPNPTVTSVSPSSGSIAGGTSVTITGTTFTGETSVTFGGTSATSVSVVNSTTITCVTPAHTVGLVTVAVTTPPGTGSLSNAYQYIAGKSLKFQIVGF
jgi:hypothetical protein